MALEWNDTTTELHRLGKAMVIAGGSQTDSQGNPFRVAITPDQRPIIPAAEIFDMNDSQVAGNIPGIAMPQVSECAIHLELLETFYVLRQKILVSEAIDTAMGIKPNRVTKTGKKGDKKTLKDTTLWERRQPKWKKFVEFAVVRFLDWQSKLDYFLGARDGITDENMPPLDIVMVWHAFLLNPRLFRSYAQNKSLYSIKLPWASIHRHINNHDWTFTLGNAAIDRYEAFTGLKWDLFHQFETWLTPESVPVSRNYPKIDAFGINVVMPFKRLASNSPATKYSELFQSRGTYPAKELRDAVIRQTAFVDKMNAHMWIRSPALEGTLRRGIDRYRQFCQLLKLSDSTMLVPTLDIDLAWHTHQCSARYYGRGMKALVGRFVNHDDTIGKEDLGDGYGDTKELFRIQFGKEYQNCGCWDCEALLSEVESALEAPEGDVDMASIASKVKEQVAYYRAVEVARRAEKPLPILTS
ncbi:Fc.00g011440.m01.CDS01 [Cosmosporella sp. VM-42]